jgi:hypothetical protein
VTHMIDRLYSDTVEIEIWRAMNAMFPHGAGQTTHHRVKHNLDTVARRAFQAGKTYALLGLMTSSDVAEHFDISKRRARALIQNRHERFGVGMKAGREWLVHRDELPQLQPNDRYRRKERQSTRPQQAGQESEVQHEKVLLPRCSFQRWHESRNHA